LSHDARRRLEEARRRWEEEIVKPALAKSPERKELFTTPSGVPVERLYAQDDIAALEYLRDLGFPGAFPYTRGVHPTAYRGRLWTMRQYAGFGAASETNQRFRYLLAEGQSGLSVAFDLPTQMGYDADHEMARSEAGKVGVAISSIEDMQDLFEGIPLDRVSTSMTINATAAILLCLYLAVGERQGVSSEKLSGTVQNDILKEYIARGTYVFPPAPSMRLVTDTFAF
jgi:methylmalonyl-CoA mutase N-terminal domain/subunit